jgi:hypothetical protein
MTRTLYDISEDLRAIAEAAEEDEGDLTPLLDWLDAVEMEASVKADHYAALIREWETRAAVREAEADRLRALVDADKGRAAKLKERLHQFLREHGLLRLDTPRFALRVQANGGKRPVQVTVPPEALPAAYQRITYAAHVDAIRAALEAGEHIPGCAFRERGTHLRIG